MTNAELFKTKNVLAGLNRGLVANQLKANTLASQLSPFGCGKQTIVGSLKSISFRPSN